GGGGQIVGKAGAGHRRVLPGGPAGLGQATLVGGGGIADHLVAPLVLHPDPDDVLPRRRRPGRRAAGGGGRDGGDPRAGRRLGPERAPQTVVGRNVLLEEGIGLPDEDETGAAVPAGPVEGLLQPAHRRRPARGELRRSQIVVAPDHVEGGEGDAAVAPAGI